MALEVSEYVLGDGAGGGLLETARWPGLGVRREPLRALEQTWYDTWDGRLHAARLALVHDGARLSLRDAGRREVAGVAWPDAPERLLAADLPAGRLRDRLAELADVRALLPVLRTTSRVRPLRAVNADAKTVVRLLVEEPAVVADGGRRIRLPTRVVVTPVRGYAKPLAAVRQTIAGDLGLPPAPEPLHDEAVRAAGGRPGGAAPAPAVTLGPDQRADGAAAILLGAQLEVIQANLPGALADVDSEFLHDLRVAVRRSRSLQRQLKGVFPPKQLAHFRAGFRGLQRATGPGRDLDVALLEHDALAALLPNEIRPDLAAVRRMLEARRRQERPALVRALRSAQTRTLLEDWAGALDELVALPVDDRPEAEQPVAAVAGRRILAVRGHLVRDGAAIGADTPAEALHDLRKTGKELRYLLESFAGLYPAEVVKPMIRALKALQDTLGRFQDRQVQADLFLSLRDDLAAAEGGPAALMALGLLLERLGNERDAARAEFAERFAAFAAAPRRKVLAATFG